MKGMIASSLPGPSARLVSPRSQFMSIYIVTFRVLAYLFAVQKVNVGKRLQYGEIRDQFLLLLIITALPIKKPAGPGRTKSGVISSVSPILSFENCSLVKSRVVLPGLYSC
jgi:hypothetical protein